MSEAKHVHVKQRTGAPEGFFRTEAAGLQWLAEAESSGGADIVDVLAADEQSLTLTHLESSPPTPGAARVFGAALAATHATGAERFGSLPPGASRYFFGPLDAPLSLPVETHDDFGTFYARCRLRPLADRVRLPADDAALLARLCDALEGDASILGKARVEPARVHGDLWSGNLMWTPSGVTLIDPAACGHHPLADIAMLVMFGAPHLEDIVGSYEASCGLSEGWREEIPLHQLFGWLVHLHLFGSSYLEPTRDALRDAAARCGL